MRKDKYSTWFTFVLIFLIIDYGRPQDVLPIGFLKPGFLMTLILAGYLVVKGRFAESKSPQTTLIFLFIALLAVHVPFAVNNYLAFTTVRDMSIMLPFMLSLIICVNTVERLKKLIFLAVCLMVYVSAYAFMNKGVGMGSFFQDENDVTLYINMWLPFCYFLFFIETERLKKWLYLAGLIIGILAVILSFSRGGFVGLVCVGFMCWLRSSKKLLSLFIIFILAAVVLIYAGDAYWARIGTARDTDQGTAAIRIESWKAGLLMFLDNPLGVGGNNYQVRFSEYQSDFFQRGMWGRVAHSLWFTLIPETGIIGIVLFFMLMKHNLRDIAVLKKISRSLKNSERNYFYALSGAFAASLVGFFSSGTFISVLYYPHYWYLTAMIVAAAKVARKVRTAEEEAAPSS